MAWWALGYEKGGLCGILGHFCKVTDIFGTFHKQHSDLQTLSNLKNAKKWRFFYSGAGKKKKPAAAGDRPKAGKEWGWGKEGKEGERKLR